MGDSVFASGQSEQYGARRLPRAASVRELGLRGEFRLVQARSRPAAHNPEMALHQNHKRIQEEVVCSGPNYYLYVQPRLLVESPLNPKMAPSESRQP